MVRSIHRREQMIEDAKTGVSEKHMPAPDRIEKATPDHGEPQRAASAAVWLLRLAILALPLLFLAIVLLR